MPEDLDDVEAAYLHFREPEKGNARSLATELEALKNVEGVFRTVYGSMPMRVARDLAYRSGGFQIKDYDSLVKAWTPVLEDWIDPEALPQIVRNEYTVDRRDGVVTESGLVCQSSRTY